MLLAVSSRTTEATEIRRSGLSRRGRSTLSDVGFRGLAADRVRIARLATELSTPPAVIGPRKDIPYVCCFTGVSS
jgi:hypothetical protein